MTKTTHNDAPADAPDRDAAAQIAREWLDQFAEAIASTRPEAVSASFTHDVYWRDIVALSWDIRTWSGINDASGALALFARERRPGAFVLDTASVQSIARSGIGPSIEVFFDFATDVGLCRGQVRLRQGEGGSGHMGCLDRFYRARRPQGA